MKSAESDVMLKDLTPNASFMAPLAEILHSE